MRDLQQEIYELIRDSKGSLWNLSHRIIDLLEDECEEKIKHAIEDAEIQNERNVYS